jgi:hypothetical protein
MYDELSNGDLARRVAAVLEMSPELALKAVESDDPELGRTWAISLLEARDLHEARQERITEHRENIRRLARV